jgi:protease I
MARITLTAVVVVVIAFVLFSGCGRSQRQASIPSMPPSPPAQPGIGPGAAPDQGPGVGTAETAAPSSRSQQEEPDLSSKRVVLVVSPKDFRDDEFEAPHNLLGKLGAKVTVASLNKGECTGVDGTKVQAVVSVQDLKAADYDAIVFIGGPGMVKHVDDQSLQNAARVFANAGKLVAAICISPVILAKAGLLKGVRATVTEGMERTLQELGAEVVSDEVVVSGKIITASGPPAAKGFARAIVAALAPQ